MSTKEPRIIRYGAAKPEETIFDYDWWNDENPHTKVHAFCKAQINEQGLRRAQALKFMKNYADIEQIGFHAHAHGTLDAHTDNTNNKVSWNISKAATDTLTNKVAKLKPRPLFLTEGGNWAQQNRAKNLTKYIDGQFRASQVYTCAIDVFRDACIFGTGIMRIYAEAGTIKCERTFPNEIIIDNEEAFYGKPKQLHQKRFVARDTLLNLYGKDPTIRHAILSAKSAEAGAQSFKTDQVEVVESWKLPISKDAKDGKHAITLENTTLLVESYEMDFFPFEFYHWNPPVLGMWGQGVCEELFGTHLEIQKLLKNIQRAQHLVAVPRVYIEKNSDIISQHIQNAIGSVIKYKGNAPTFYTPTAMNPEVYNHLERLWAKGFECVGISQLSATAQKPSGLNAGVALRTFHDIETERFSTVVQRWEQFFLNIASKVVSLSSQLYSENKKLSVKIEGGKFIETIKWKDVDLPESKYIMKSYPTNILPATPEGKLQRVQEMMQAGLLNPEDGKRLLDFPDLEQYTSLEQASDDIIHMQIDMIIEDGEYQNPPEFVNLQRALVFAQNSYLKAKKDRVDEDRLDMIQRYYQEVKDLMEVQQAAAAMQQAPVPMANPETTPTSELLPNIPGSTV